MAKQVNVLHIVSSALTLGDMTFTEGQKITNEAAVAAYFMTLYQTLEDTESTLSVPEVLATWNAIQATTNDRSEDFEIAVVEAMKARQSGADDDNGIPLMDQVSAANRIAMAFTMGAKLGEDANNKIAEFIAARKTIKIGPVAMMLIVRTHWTAEEIDAMPMPWSKPEGKNVTVDKSNMTFDIYKTDLGGEVKRGSWFEDNILALTTPQGLQDSIERVSKLSDQEKTKDHIAFKKTNQSDLNSATNLLRRGVMLDRVLREIDTFEYLEYQVRMRIIIDPDTKEQTEVPATDKADYPILIWQKGDMGNAINLTLNNLMKAFDRATDKSGVPLEPAISRLEAAKAAGGLLEHFKLYILPKKERGKNKFPAVTDAETSFAALFRLGSFYSDQGTMTTLRKLAEPGEVGEAYISALGDVMTALMPVWNAPGVRDRYNVLQEVVKKDTQQKLIDAAKKRGDVAA